MKRSIDQGTGGRWRALYKRPDDSVWFMSPARGFSTQALASKARDDFEDALIKPHAQWAVEEERRLWSGRSNKATAARIAAERQKWAWRLGLGMLGAAIIGYILGAFAL